MKVSKVDPDSCVPELPPSKGCSFTVSVDTSSLPSKDDYEFKCSVQIGTKTSSNPPKETSVVVPISTPIKPPKVTIIEA